MEGGQTPRLQVGSQDTDPHAETASGEPAAPVDAMAATAISGPRRTDPLAPTLPSQPPERGGSIPPGTRLSHFRIDAPLGAGGMGDVYRGWDTALERPVAIKVLRARSHSARERFLREARAQAKVRHPNVVPIHYVGEHEGVVFLSMDLVEGASMEDRLRQGPIAVDEALNVAAEVAHALAEGAKSGLVHRDVKPSNVLLGPGGRVLLADFGLAKSIGARESQPGDPTRPSGSAITHHGSIVGTPAYMAPEQTHPQPVDHRADMYALGGTLYEMVTGRPPFESREITTLIEQQREATPPAPCELAPGLPPNVEALILRLLEKAPADRFAAYPELLAAIEAARPRVAPTAGFFVRGVALMVDCLVIAAVGVPVSLIEPALTFPMIALLFGLLEWRWGRTLGKRLFALRVVGAHDDRPRLGWALLRNAIKFWGPLLTVIPLLNSGFITLVIGAVWLLSFGLGVLPGKRTLHDRASRTRVAYALGS